jgi:hypothetical protein
MGSILFDSSIYWALLLFRLSTCTLQLDSVDSEWRKSHDLRETGWLIFCVSYSTLLHLPPSDSAGCWDRAQKHSARSHPQCKYSLARVPLDRLLFVTKNFNSGMKRFFKKCPQLVRGQSQRGIMHWVGGMLELFCSVTVIHATFSCESK